jgi:hypothetical protein
MKTIAMAVLGLGLAGALNNAPARALGIERTLLVLPPGATAKVLDRCTIWVGKCLH